MTFWRDPVAWWCSLGRPFQALGRIGALAVLSAVVLALAWASLTMSDRADMLQGALAEEVQEDVGDVALYSRISERFTAGESYYAAALDEQRKGNYPTTPFVTVRLPTMAWIHGHLGSGTVKMLAYGTLILAVVSLFQVLLPVTSLLERAAAAVLLYLGGMGQLGEPATLLHELPAGLLLTLALAIYRPQRWWPSLLVAGLALAIRELALPFLLLWAFFALWQRRWKEAGAVIGVILAFAIAMYFHAGAVMAEHLPTDLPSPGWHSMLGPQIALAALSSLTILYLIPPEIAGPVILLAMLGWIGLGGRMGLFATLWFAGFWLAMALFARVNNIYWVMLIMPAYAAGLAFVPRAISDLVQAAMGRHGQRQS